VVAFGMAYIFAVGIKSLINKRKTKLEQERLLEEDYFKLIDQKKETLLL